MNESLRNLEATRDGIQTRLQYPNGFRYSKKSELIESYRECTDQIDRAIGQTVLVLATDIYAIQDN